MWFVDIVVDLPWFATCQGKLGKPKSRAEQLIAGTEIESTFLLYGDDLEIRHLRVLIHIDDKSPPHTVVDANINRWVNLLEVSTGLVAARTATTATISRNNTSMIVFMAEGGEQSDSCLIDPKYEPTQPLDYQAAAKLMVAWQPDFRVHLFYLGRFLNQELPPEVRWLNGYRVLEWHFRRGKTGLSKDSTYQTFLEAHGQALDKFLMPGQQRKGLIEDVRATCAHSILSRTADPRNSGGSTNLIEQTFQGLETLVMTVMNEGSCDTVSFVPKSPRQR